jgi:DNA replication licensing factor MCM6
MTHKAAVYLRRSYVSLRSQDVMSHKSSYRITVRQLESLIRLSEAIARLHCSIEITETHVSVAAKLLSNSIMKVHCPDVELEGPIDDKENRQINLNPNAMVTSG